VGDNSAGIGRSGTFAAIHHILATHFRDILCSLPEQIAPLIRPADAETSLSSLHGELSEAILDLRKQRHPATVQTRVCVRLLCAYLVTMCADDIIRSNTFFATLFWPIFYTPLSAPARGTPRRGLPRPPRPRAPLLRRPLKPRRARHHAPRLPRPRRQPSKGQAACTKWSLSLCLGA